jgi:hypothetical protein
MKGTVKGNVIELDEPLPFVEGTRVEVAVTPEVRPRKGSPKAVLLLAGTLTHEEAESLREAIGEIRRIDARLWERQAK